jgi:hypothetical protein
MRKFPRWASRYVAVVSTVLAFGGCIEVRTGAYAHPVDAAGKVSSSDATRSGLRISGEEVQQLSSAYFGLLEITFENTSSRWLRVMSVSARFTDAQSNQRIQVPVGEDLQSWLRATLEHYDISTGAQGGFSEVADAWLTLHYALGGGLCAAPSGGAPVAPAASAAPSGAAPATAPAAPGSEPAPGVPPPPLVPLTLDSANARAGSDDLVSALPDSHVMHVPFAVPPGLFTRRFLVLDTSQAPRLPCLRQLLLEIQLEDGSKERVWLRFRGDQVGPSDWQSGACKGG